MNRQLGLIGKTLTHSFSKKYFTEKFQNENIIGWDYNLYPLEHIELLPNLLSSVDSLRGLNVTIPYKTDVIPLLDILDETASAIGAVNTIDIREDGRLVGYNTDVSGFECSLVTWMQDTDMKKCRALVLGTGGASRAVCYVLTKLGMEFSLVSRNKITSGYAYSELDTEVVSEHKLVVNTTPLGTYPKVDEAPQIPYHGMSAAHWCYDLVYNPEVTTFMQKSIAYGARVRNGYEMLVGQAECAWQIWNS